MIVFHHIPKSAGTSFSVAITQANDAPSLMVGAEGLAAYDNDRILTSSYLAGHVTYPEIAPLIEGRETLHFSVLRHPLERLISYFEMAYRDIDLFRDEVCHRDKWSVGFEVFLDRFIDTPGLNNLMCSYFHTSRSFYDAIKVITEKFDFVGGMDNLGAVEDFLAHALPTHGLAVPDAYPKRNVSSKGEPFWRDMPGHLLDRVRTSNKEDFLLFDWLMTRHQGAYWRPGAEYSRQDAA